MLRSVLGRSAVVALLPVLAVLAVLAPSPANADEDHRPVTIDQSLSTPQDTPIAVTLSATDEDGDALTYDYATFSGCHCHESNGTSSGTLPNLVFTPDRGFQGQATIWFQADDGQLSSQTGPGTFGVITINVTAPAPPPAPMPPARFSQCFLGGWSHFGFRSPVACLLYVARHRHHH